MFLTQFETILGLPDYIGYIFFFIVGAVIGSFLNVVIHRVPAGESIVFPNSACPKCKAKIKGYDNIPILSWLILGGKCRNCKNPISARYPAVELLTALIFVLFFWRFDLTPVLPRLSRFRRRDPGADLYRRRAHDPAQRDHLPGRDLFIRGANYFPDLFWSGVFQRYEIRAAFRPYRVADMGCFAVGCGFGRARRGRRDLADRKDLETSSRRGRNGNGRC